LPMPPAALPPSKPRPPSSAGNTVDITSTILQRHHSSSLAQAETHSEVLEATRMQRQTQMELCELVARSQATDKPTLSREQLTRLANQVVVQRNLLQHLCRLLQAHDEDVSRLKNKGHGMWEEADSTSHADSEVELAPSRKRTVDDKACHGRSVRSTSPASSGYESGRASEATDADLEPLPEMERGDSFSESEADFAPILRDEPGLASLLPVSA